jgi:hypothetical protein
VFCEWARRIAFTNWCALAAGGACAYFETDRRDSSAARPNARATTRLVGHATGGPLSDRRLEIAPCSFSRSGVCDSSSDQCLNDRATLFSTWLEAGLADSRSPWKTNHVFILLLSRFHFARLIGSSKKHWTSRINIMRFFSRCAACVPSPNST